MYIRQTPELKLKEIQQSFSKQNANDAQCREMERICQKADKRVLARRRHLEAEGEIMYNDLQKAKQSQDKKENEVKEVQKIAKVMSELEHQELVQLKTNQLFQNNSHEFQSLKRQTQTNRVQDELLRQIKQKEIMRKEEKAKEYCDMNKKQLLKNNFDEIQFLEKQSRNARLQEELLGQIKEKEKMQKENKSREYNSDMKMIEARKNNDMDRKETGECNKSQDKLKTKSIREELELMVKIKNEIKEKECKKNKDEEKQMLKNYHKFNESEEKKINENRRKTIQYGKELQIMIGQNIDTRNKQRIQMLNDESIIEMEIDTNKCI